MRILLTDLHQGHSHVVRAVPADSLDLGDWLTPTRPAEVDLDADRRGDQVTLRGQVRVVGDRDCGRCATSVPVELEAELVVLADRRGSDSPEDEAALEQEGSVLYHDGIELNLAEPLREALILEVPVVTLCRPDCAGLCPQCGQDKNTAACTCTASEGDPRWDALKKLKDGS